MGTHETSTYLKYKSSGLQGCGRDEGCRCFESRSKEGPITSWTTAQKVSWHYNVILFLGPSLPTEMKMTSQSKSSEAGCKTGRTHSQGNTAETMEECLLSGLCLASFLIQPRSTCLEMVLSTMGWVGPLHQLMIKIFMTIGQSDLGNCSIKIFFSESFRPCQTENQRELGQKVYFHKNL